MFQKILFLHGVFVCVCRGDVYVSTVLKKVSDPLELELQVVVSHLMW